MADDKGLYPKYVISYADGSPINDFKFVLSPETEYASLKALETYALHTQNEQLKGDINAWIENIKAVSVELEE